MSAFAAYVYTSQPTQYMSTTSSRTMFMIETLANLKNNKSKRNVTQNQGGAAVERMKKFLSGLSKTRHGISFSTCYMGLVTLFVFSISFSA